MARPLALPPQDLNTQALYIEHLNPSRLYRVSRHLTGEPYFGRSGGNRFDSTSREYGTCYLGCSLTTALAESVLHDLVPRGGYYAVSAEDLAACYVHQFFGTPLRLANLTGALSESTGCPRGTLRHTQLRNPASLVAGDSLPSRSGRWLPVYVKTGEHRKSHCPV